MPDSFGAVVFDARGRLLIRRVAGDFGGARWTWPKGRPDPGEDREQTARRELLEETGWTAGELTWMKDAYQGTTGQTFYAVAPADAKVGQHDAETAEIRWVTPKKASELIGESPNPFVVKRDHAVLRDAVTEWTAILDKELQAYIGPELKEALLDHQRALGRLEAASVGELVALTTNAADELRSDLARLAPGTFSEAEARAHLVQLEAIATGAGRKLGQDVGLWLEDLGLKASEIGRNSMVAQVSAAEKHFGLRQVRLELASDLLDDGLLERYRVSSNYYGAQAIADMRQSMALATLKGETLAQLTDRLAKDVQIPKWRAERIARTETSHASHRRQLADMRDIDDGSWWKQLVTLFDNRTADDSKVIHGQRRRLKNKFKRANGEQFDFPPDRPNDRGTMIFVPGTRRKPKAPPATPSPNMPRPSVGPSFPPDPRKLDLVKRLGGSTGAELVVDNSTGEQFVRKMSGPRLQAAHLRSEFAADRLYEAAGVAVPEGKLYELDDGRTAKLTRFIEGRSLGDLTGAEREAARKELRQGLAMDAILGNWDVVGLAGDNVLVDASGKVWRIDNGGSLAYRAQGARKSGQEWNDYPTELWSLRRQNRDLRPGDQHSFDALQAPNEGWKAIIEQLKALDDPDVRRRLQEVIDDTRDVPRSELDTVMRRLDEATRLVPLSETMTADSWLQRYIDRLASHVMGLRQEGLARSLPKKLSSQVRRTRGVQAWDVKLVDENGRDFDELRSTGRNMQLLQAYVDRVGKWSRVADWGSAQAGSSWSTHSQALKVWLADQRSLPTSTYWWPPGGLADARRQLAALWGGAEEEAAESFAAYHAFTVELLGAVDMPTNDRQTRTLQVFRTEGANVLAASGIQKGPGRQMKRGALESASMMRPVSVHGAELTIQRVPHHRVFATYLNSRATRGGSMFLGDTENEATVLLDGIPFEYR